MGRRIAKEQIKDTFGKEGSIVENLFRTRDDVMAFLFDKRDAITQASRTAMDMQNEEGAKILRAASEALTAIVRYVVDVPFCK